MMKKLAIAALLCAPMLNGAPAYALPLTCENAKADCKNSTAKMCKICWKTKGNTKSGWVQNCVYKMTIEVKLTCGWLLRSPQFNTSLAEN